MYRPSIASVPFTEKELSRVMYLLQEQDKEIWEKCQRAGENIFGW